MSIKETEKQEILQALNEGKKISEISDAMGISRESIRKIKNSETANSPKTDLENFNETYEVTGEEKTAKELLKEVGNLAPKIVKERLEAGELVLSMFGSTAATLGMKLEELLRKLDQLPERVISLQSENQELNELIDGLHEAVKMQVDRAVIKKCVNEMTLLAIQTNKFDLGLISVYEDFLWSRRPSELAHYRKRIELINQGINPDEFFEKESDDLIKHAIDVSSRAKELLARSKVKVPAPQISS